MKNNSWTKLIRDALPESGDTSIIVTTQGGVEYISLSRDLVDAEQKRSKKRYFAHVSITLLFLLSIIVMAAYHFYTVTNMQRSIVSTNQQLEMLTEPLTNLAEQYPLLFMVGKYNEEADYAGTIEAMKSLISLQDESFRFYVESTRLLLERDEQELLTELAGFGLIKENLARSDSEFALGGFTTPDEINDLLSYYIQDPLLTMLDEHGKTLDLVQGLPTGQPMQNSVLTSRYGVRRHPISGRREPHNGIDVVSYVDAKVHVTGQGVVTAAGRDGGYGKAVVVDHGNGLSTVYAHLSKIHVKAGDVLEEGQVVGIMGNTGNSTATHLHYEIRIDDKAVDPLRLIGKFDHVLQ